MRMIDDGRGTPAPGEIVRATFGGTELSTSAEVAAAAVAAQARAAVEARYVLAMRNRRDWEDVRTRIERECKRPSFAKVAIYRKPVGKGIEGPSIRFAEAALRCMGNVFQETVVIHESAHQRIVQVAVTDIEQNVAYSAQIVIDKTVERRQVKDGQKVLGERVNANGDKVFLVQATEDELLNKQNALISKAVRTAGLRILPGDIKDRCMEIVRDTQEQDVASDPDAAKRAIVDAFVAIGVPALELAAYLKHSLDRITKAEIVELRKVYQAVNSGEATWDEIMNERGATGSDELQSEARDRAAQRFGFANAKAAAEAQGKPAPPVETEVADADVSAGVQQKPEEPKVAAEASPKVKFGMRHQPKTNYIEGDWK